MNKQDDFYRQVGDLERENKKKARKEKWAKREKSFWRSFLFTEDGKPKSGLMVYTFCLSFVFLGFYVAAFYFVIEELTAPLSALPPVWANLLESLLVGGVGALLSGLLHALFSDKRLAFGTHLWLALYAVACLVTLVVMLWGDWEAVGAMLVFFAWFVLIPLAIGLTVTSILFFRSRRRQRQSPVQEPEWKKYTRPR